MKDQSQNILSYCIPYLCRTVRPLIKKFCDKEIIKKIEINNCAIINSETRNHKEIDSGLLGKVREREKSKEEARAGEKRELALTP